MTDFDRVLAVNLRGAFLVSQAVAKYMVDEIESREDRSRLTERPYSIINMSSINDTVALPDYLAYTGLRAVLLQMTRSMALELAPYGIRVNAVGPRLGQDRYAFGRSRRCAGENSFPYAFGPRGLAG